MHHQHSVLFMRNLISIVLLCSRKAFFGACILLGCFGSFAAVAQELDENAEAAFAEFLQEFRTEAIAKGIRPATLDAVLPGITLTRQAIVADRNQPEFNNTFAVYLQRVSPWRVENGRKVLREQGDMIRPVAAEHGVPPQYVLAILGMESNYGTYPLTLSVFDVVATLAFDKRRSAQFRNELLANFEILDKGYATFDGMKSSWAGALGYPQFNASMYLKLAVDQDGDGMKDLWSMGPDVIGSVANYLKTAGWQEDEAWGYEVNLPAGAEQSLMGEQSAGLNPDPTCKRFTTFGIWRTLQQWQTLGVRMSDGADLPDSSLSAALIMGDEGQNKGYLVQRNFCAIMGYNPASKYAVAIGLLADEISKQ
jgi:membrane-bound lytic murein transglycosylase B